MEVVIDFDTEGAVHALHDDAFPLGFLGEMDVARASNITFNKNTQCWDVTLPDDTEPRPHAAGFSGYDRARGFEILWLNACRLADVHPSSETGRTICKAARNAYTYSGDSSLVVAQHYMEPQE